MEINLKQIEDSAKGLGIPNDFRDPRLHFMFEVICGSLAVLSNGGPLGEKLFKQEYSLSRIISLNIIKH